MKIVDNVSGKLRESSHIEFAERVLLMSKKSDVWSVIEEIVKFWKKDNPRKYKSLLIDVTEARKSRANATGTSGKGMRYLADIPQQVMDIIRVVYPQEVFDQRFFREFAKRFPEFRVAERI